MSCYWNAQTQYNWTNIINAIELNVSNWIWSRQTIRIVQLNLNWSIDEQRSWSRWSAHDIQPMIFRLKILSFAYHNHHDVCTELKLELVELSWAELSCMNVKLRLKDIVIITRRPYSFQKIDEQGTGVLDWCTHVLKQYMRFKK